MSKSSLSDQEKVAPGRTLDTLEAQVRALNGRLNHLPRLLTDPQDLSLGLRSASDFEGFLPPGHHPSEHPPLPFDAFAKAVDKNWSISGEVGTACRVKVKDVRVTKANAKAWSGKAELSCRSARRAAPPCVSSATALIEINVEERHWVLKTIKLTTAQRRCPKATRFVDATDGQGLRYQGQPFAKQGREAMNWQGVGSADVNGDGRWDLFVPGRVRNHLYLNRGKNGFIEVAKAWGVESPPGGTGVVFFDYDNDGDQDLFVGYPGDGPATQITGVRAFENRRNREFVDRSRELGFHKPHAAYPLVALDANNDGFVDLYVGSYGHLLDESNNSWVHATNGAPDALYLNQGGNAFKLAEKGLGVGGTAFTYAAAAADIDRDGRLDLYAGNDFAPNSLLLNDNKGHFREASKTWGLEAPGNAMGVTFADFDADGQLDIIVTHMASSAGNRILQHVAPELLPNEHETILPFAVGNAILMRRGTSYRALPAEAVGVDSGWAWGPAVADFDLDGDLDLYVVNGYVTGESEHDT